MTSLFTGYVSPARRLSSTFPTQSATLRGNDSIEHIVRVPLWAVRLKLPRLAATLHILRKGYKLSMAGIHAATVLAQMVKAKTFRNWADEKFICEAVACNCHAARQSKVGITSFIVRPLVEPTLTQLGFDDRPVKDNSTQKALSRGFWRRAFTHKWRSGTTSLQIPLVVLKAPTMCHMYTVATFDSAETGNCILSRHLKLILSGVKGWAVNAASPHHFIIMGSI